MTEAVHDEGGRIFLQLWHVGRLLHPDFHNGELPVAPSAEPFGGGGADMESRFGHGAGRHGRLPDTPRADPCRDPAHRR